jgi:hypothetical protein
MQTRSLLVESMTRENNMHYRKRIVPPLPAAFL